MFVTIIMIDGSVKWLALQNPRVIERGSKSIVRNTYSDSMLDSCNNHVSR